MLHINISRVHFGRLGRCFFVVFVVPFLNILLYRITKTPVRLLTSLHERVPRQWSKVKKRRIKKKRMRNPYGFTHQTVKSIYRYMFLFPLRFSISLSISKYYTDCGPKNMCWHRQHCYIKIEATVGKPFMCVRKLWSVGRFFLFFYTYFIFRPSHTLRCLFF